MALVTGNTIAALDTRTVTIQSNATATFAHGFGSAADVVIPIVQGDVATSAATDAVMPHLSVTDDATNVSVKNYGLQSCSAKIQSQIVHSIIG